MLSIGIWCGTRFRSIRRPSITHRWSRRRARIGAGSASSSARTSRATRWPSFTSRCSKPSTPSRENTRAMSGSLRCTRMYRWIAPSRRPLTTRWLRSTRFKRNVSTRCSRRISPRSTARVARSAMVPSSAHELHEQSSKNAKATTPSFPSPASASITSPAARRAIGSPTRSANWGSLSVAIGRR